LGTSADVFYLGVGMERALEIKGDKRDGFE
jgi:hypothetical protein